MERNLRSRVRIYKETFPMEILEEDRVLGLLAHNVRTVKLKE